MGMLLTPLPGLDRKHLHETLRQVDTDVSNQYTGGPHGYYERLLSYLDWTSRDVERLGSLMSSDDLDRLVLTKRYEQLLAGVASLAGEQTQRLTDLLVSLELRQRTDAFDQAVKALGRELALWERRGRPVVADSSFYIEHPQKLEEANFPELLDVWDDSIHLMVPMVVVDELDSLKRSKDRQERSRAGYPLPPLDRPSQTCPRQ